jgi:hypothetical protein
MHVDADEETDEAEIMEAEEGLRGEASGSSCTRPAMQRT